MKTREEIIDCLRANKAQLQSRFPLKSIALFGSYARNDHTETSDIDILVEFSEPVGFEFLDLHEALENLLKRKIDLVTRNAIKAHYLPYIEDDLINI